MKRRTCFVSNSSSSSYTCDDEESRTDEDRWLLAGVSDTDKVEYLLRKIDEVSSLLHYDHYSEDNNLTEMACSTAHSVLSAEKSRLEEMEAAERKACEERLVPADISCLYCEIEGIKPNPIEQFGSEITYRPRARLVMGCSAAAPLYRCDGCGKLWQRDLLANGTLVEIRL